ncbi:MAG TPA: thermonuclease family protein [Dehalococcoidia bacterium]|nr:thermonuclease family protein [Dehalococcoidia bacterium]
MIRFRRPRRYNVAVILAALAAALVIAIIAGVQGEDEPSSPTPTRAPASPTATLPAPPLETPTPSTSGAPIGPAATPAPADRGFRPAFVHPDPSSLTRATVVDVVDGDTIDAIVSGVEERVRLYGVDTPERGDRCFFEAAARTETLTRDGVLLEPGPRARDRYGRLLAYVYTAGGVSVDAQLIAEGLGTAWREDGQHRDAFVALEGSARAAGAGCLWR